MNDPKHAFNIFPSAGWLVLQHFNNQVILRNSMENAVLQQFSNFTEKLIKLKSVMYVQFRTCVCKIHPTCMRLLSVTPECPPNMSAMLDKSQLILPNSDSTPIIV